MLIALSLLLIVIVSVVLFVPYRTWPVSGHFGLFSIWTLFRDRSAHLPKELTLKNFSLSRIFLHHMVEVTARLFGKVRLGKKVMYVQFGAIAISAVLLFCVCVIDFKLPHWIALLGACLFLFIASRPQFVPDFSNSEPFYNIFSTLAMGILLWNAGATEATFTQLFLFALVFVFAGLNAKVHFVCEPAFIGFVYLAAHHGDSHVLAALSGGCAVAALIFYVIMRKNVQKKNVAWLRNLVNYNRTVSQFSFFGLIHSFQSRYAMALNRSPLAGFMALALLATLFSPWDVTTLVLVAWMLSSWAVIAAQGRFELYHFLVLFPSLTLLSVRGLGAASDIHPVLLLLPLGVAAVLARRSLSDFFRFYNTKSPLAQRMALAVDTFPYYWETRFQPVIQHSAASRDRVLTWGIVPEFYHLADSAPVSSVTYIHRQLDYLQPDWRSVLKGDVARKIPVWIYDFNAWNTVYGRFNPLGFYFATGLTYRAEKRHENIVYYKLMDQGQERDVRQADRLAPLGFNIYTLCSPIKSLLQDALDEAGFSISELPPSWRLDADVLIACLARGQVLGMPRLDDEDARLWEQHPRELALSRIVTHLHRHEDQQAKEVFAALNAREPDLGQVSFFVQVVKECLGRLLQSAPNAIAIDPASMNSQPLADVFHTVNLLLFLSSTPLLLPQEKKAFFDALGQLQLDGGDYRDDDIKNMELLLGAVRQVDAQGIAGRLSRAGVACSRYSSLFDSMPRLYAELAGLDSFAASLQKNLGRQDVKVALYGLTDDALLFVDAFPDTVQVVSIADSFKYNTFSDVKNVPVVNPWQLTDSACDAVLILMTAGSSIQAVSALLRQAGFTKPVYCRKSNGAFHTVEPVAC